MIDNDFEDRIAALEPKALVHRHGHPGALIVALNKVAKLREEAKGLRELVRDCREFVKDWDDIARMSEMDEQEMLDRIDEALKEE